MNILYHDNYVDTLTVGWFVDIARALDDKGYPIVETWETMEHAGIKAIHERMLIALHNAGIMVDTETKKP